MSYPAPWIILFLPLGAAVVITLFGLKRPGLAAGLSVGAILVSFFLSIKQFAAAASGFVPPDLSFSWLSVGGLDVGFSLNLDRLSLLMLLIVTGVGSVIHIYSTAYMKGDPSFPRFFACLSLFTFSMLGIVLAGNFVQMFIFWELVGLSSYLLIGFWFEKPSAADAAKKAFLTNRVGDFGFLAGIIMVWAATGTVGFEALKNVIPDVPSALGPAATCAGLLVFCGAAGKSAQFPLHVWLPDAMEGPTPVSALIHAATMVAAGVYMLSRVFFVFNIPTLQVIAWIGGFTALMAALIACQQNDIKRILAYSTLSQLGYMVMAVGLRQPPAAMFHLATHAFFKALLFLGAGSVIHAVAGEQDIWKMGRLKDKMPVTYWTFLLGTLALCGVPPLSGFYSKDSILAAALAGPKALFVLAVLVAFLTTFYMFRLLFVVFCGAAKSDLPGHAHESPAAMTVPLGLLAVATVAGGFFGIPQWLARHYGLEAPEFPGVMEPFHAAPVAAAAGLVVIVLGLLLALAIYGKAASDPLPAKLGGLSRLLANKFYFDELYAGLIAVTQDALAMLAAALDAVLKFAILFLQGTVDLSGRALRMAQTGSLQTYTLFFAAGIALALWFIFLR